MYVDIALYYFFKIQITLEKKQASSGTILIQNLKYLSCT